MLFRGSLARDFPVDFLYTWVDGADPVWRERKAARMAQFGRSLPPASAVASVRFADHDELKYSLRSVAAFAPWVRRIYIVTDAQAPAWLDREHPKIRVVDHREIFPDPDACLPTYNAAAIESQLHRAPGIAEHFVFFNDDMFLGRPVQPGEFFGPDGEPVLFTKYSRPRRRDWHFDTTRIPAGRDELHFVRMTNARIAVRDRTGIEVHHDLRHVSYPLRRSYMEELTRDTYAEELARTAPSPFRAPTDVLPAYLHSFHALATGKARVQHLVPPSAKPRLKDLLHALRGTPRGDYVRISSPGYETRLKAIERSRPMQFCLNDTLESRPEGKARMVEFLQRYFPQPSPFEKAAG